MQTFLPYPDFQQSAGCLDDKRLGKQRVECLQILRTLVKGPFSCSVCKSSWSTHENNPVSNHRKIITPWYNHPAVQMWKGYEGCLWCYTREIIYEWKQRGFKDTCYEKLIQYFKDYLEGNKSTCKQFGDPPWLTKEFYLSHQSNLIRKLPEYYRPIFGPDVPSDLPYVWPSKLV